MSFAFTLSPAGPMAVPRVYHSAAALPDGTVLVCGGYGAGSIRDSAEFYDPAAGGFRPAGRMTTAREYAAAAPLPGGRVLITGGRSSDRMASSAEVYDPALRLFQPLPPMSAPRGEHTATPLDDGRVLVAGGSTHVADLFDPEAGRFTATAGAMIDARVGHTATLLDDGRVLLAGGFSGSAFGGKVVASAELYDPASHSFTPTAPMAEPRYRHAAARLPDGRVLVTGGWSGQAMLATAELYDPGTRPPVVGGEGGRGSWTAVVPMAEPRMGHTMTRLPDGSTLIVGGHLAATAEQFDPRTGRFHSLGPIAQPREGHTATLLPDGSVLIVGGYDEGALASAELVRGSGGRSGS